MRKTSRRKTHVVEYEEYDEEYDEDCEDCEECVCDDCGWDFFVREYKTPVIEGAYLCAHCAISLALVRCEYCNGNDNVQHYYSVFNSEGIIMCRRCASYECCPGCGYEAGGLCKFCRSNFNN